MGHRAAQRGHASVPSRVLESVAATLLLVILLVGPISLVTARIVRFVSAPVTTTTSMLDVVAPLLLVVWCVMVWILAGMGGPLRSARIRPLRLDRFARLLVERSLFGVGPLVGWTRSNPDNRLTQLVSPRPVSDIVEALASHDKKGSKPNRAPKVGSDGSINRRRRLDVRPGTEPTVPLWSGPTRRHDVARGDTYWSLAERYLSDGKKWGVIRDLNVGRELSPGVILTDEDDLQRGWTVVVPDIEVERST